MKDERGGGPPSLSSFVRCSHARHATHDAQGEEPLTSVPSPAVRHDWQPAEVRAVYDTPLLELVFRAAQAHRAFHDGREVQVCKLINIKTGGCPEDCKYCSQSSRYQTDVKPEPLMDRCEVIDIAARARAAGVTRVCMGAAWREVRDSAQFDRVLDMVKDVTALGLEVCCTLGMLTDA